MPRPSFAELERVSPPREKGKCCKNGFNYDISKFDLGGDPWIALRASSAQPQWIVPLDRESASIRCRCGTKVFQRSQIIYEQLVLQRVVAVSVHEYKVSAALGDNF